MDIPNKYELGQILIDELEKGIAKLSDPHDEELVDILNRSYRVKLKMQMIYRRVKSPTLLDQINQLDSIIKKVEQMHNKHVTEM